MANQQAQGKKRLTPKQRAAKKRRNIIIFVVELFVLAIVVLVAWAVIRFTETEHNNLVLGSADNIGETGGNDQPNVFVNPDIYNRVENGDDELSRYMQIALFGVDSRKQNLGSGDNRSDTIIVACIDRETKEIRLASVYRDSYLYLGPTVNNGDYYDKCNAAYSYGGPEAAVTMLNLNLDLAISDYMTVGFLGLIDVVNAVGGIDLEIESNEIIHLNNYASVMADELNLTYTPVQNAGYQHLDGLQATAYCRIRAVGNDYGRTERQRKVIIATLEAAKRMSATQLVDVVNKVFSEVSTSFTIGEITDMIGDLNQYTIVETTGFPAMEMLRAGTVGGKGSCVVPIDLATNVTWLHEFLFGETDYEPTADVQRYSSRIASDTAPYIGN